MVISNEQLVEIVGAGGIVVMDVSTMTFNQIHAIAVAAASTGKGKDDAEEGVGAVTVDPAEAAEHGSSGADHVRSDGLSGARTNVPGARSTLVRRFWGRAKRTGPEKRACVD